MKTRAKPQAFRSEKFGREQKKNNKRNRLEHKNQPHLKYVEFDPKTELVKETYRIVCVLENRATPFRNHPMDLLLC